MDNLPPCLAAQAAFVDLHEIQWSDITRITATFSPPILSWRVEVTLRHDSPAIRTVLAAASAGLTRVDCGTSDTYILGVSGGDLRWSVPKRPTPLVTTSVTPADALAALPVAL